MAAMPPMLAYTVQSSPWTANAPSVVVGFGSNATWMTPAQPQDDSYWIVFFSRANPRQKVKEWVIPGNNNSQVPPGIDTYINDPEYIFAVATQTLSTLHVPQGPFYDFLAKYGAGRELQKLEQLNAVLSCGGYGHVNYALTSQAGGRNDPKIPPPPSYEMGDYRGNQVIMMMSLMPMESGAPPYSICDCYTFRAQGAHHA